ncbi:unnamed protein product [Lampetra fluviatilis]
MVVMVVLVMVVLVMVVVVMVVVVVVVVVMMLVVMMLEVMMMVVAMMLEVMMFMVVMMMLMVVMVVIMVVVMVVLMKMVVAMRIMTMMVVVVELTESPSRADSPPPCARLSAPRLLHPHLTRQPRSESSPRRQPRSATRASGGPAGRRPPAASLPFPADSAVLHEEPAERTASPRVHQRDPRRHAAWVMLQS